MAVSRRRFIEGAAGIGTVAALATLSAPEQSLAHTPTALPNASPPVEVIALNRMGYGPRSGDIAHVQTLGLAAYIEEQLAAPADDTGDDACLQRMNAARLKIKYDAVNEVRPLSLLGKSAVDLWSLQMNGTVWEERIRPVNEVYVATWLRAIYSKWQLREVLVEFWHDHFNVNAYGEAAISAGFPEYDRIMRQNCFGNFRTFIEQITRSVSMMYYLDNQSNQVKGGSHAGNENYARELFELHTLGSDNYLKFYNDRKLVGTTTYKGESFARGYIDYDVYDAARSFTGWTIANGYYARPTLNDGSFFYDQSWHDVNDKAVLSLDGYSNIPHDQGPLKDGKDVLDLVSYHVGTAQHLCTKLCRRLIADNPPQSVVDAAVAVWMANRQKPDQIEQVLRTILLSNEFKTTWGAKTKRPFEFLASFLRAVNAEMPVDVMSVNGDAGAGGYWNGLMYNYEQAGHKRFAWPTPTGNPDLASIWVSTNGMLRRWNLPYVISQSWGGNVTIDLVAQTTLTQTCTQIVDAWIAQLCSFTIAATTRQALIDFFAQTANGGDPNQPPAPVKDEYGTASDIITDRLNSMVQLLAMSPDFQQR